MAEVGGALIVTVQRILHSRVGTHAAPSAESSKEKRVADLMEKGRFSDAANEATSDLKRPPMDDEAVAAFEAAVVPPSLQQHTLDETPKRADRDDPHIDPHMFAFVPETEDAMDPDLKVLKGLIAKCKKGKGAGVLGDTLDFYKLYAGSGNSNGKKLTSLLEMIRRVIRGQLPSLLRPVFNLLAGSLFLKPETTPKAYRPIGCPSSLNRLVGKYFCAVTKVDISRMMLKANQFAVGVKGGMALLLASLQLLVQKYIKMSEDSLDDDSPADSTRALLSLDLMSMFNVANLDEFFKWLDSDPILAKYVPFFEMRYKTASTYVLKKGDGSFTHVTQPGGCAQGCPLAPLIASCCLMNLVNKFLEGGMGQHVSPPSAASADNVEYYAEDKFTDPTLINPQAPLEARRALDSIRRQQKHMDDTHGGPIGSYMDDTWSVASYSFILAFARFLIRHGPAAGVFVNWRKTQILLGSHWDRDWRDVSENGKTILQRVNIFAALKELGVPDENIITSPTDGPTALAKIKGGVKILGAPFGFAGFCKQFRAKTLDKQMKAFDAVSEAATDKEHLYKLIRFCIIPKVYHMFSAAASLDDIADFAQLCHDQHIVFFQRFLNNGKVLDSDTKHSFDLAMLLIRQGGIQFTSPLQFYIAGFLATWSRLFYVGTSPDKDEESDEQNDSPLHASIQSIIAAELKSPSLLCCVDYKRAFDKLDAAHPKEFGEELAGGEGITGLIRAAGTDRLQHAIVDITLTDVFRQIHSRLRAEESATGRISHLRKIMPSSAQMLGSMFLENLDMGPGKMPSDSFLLYTKIKLGMPILDMKVDETQHCPFCSKSNVIDRFGGHIFACDHFMAHRTKYMHNRMRDTFASILGKYAKLGSTKASCFSSVTIEKPGLVENTAIRPADVYLTLDSEKQMLDEKGKHLPATAVALDVTYTALLDNPGCDGLKNTSSFSPAAFPHLLDAEQRKRSDNHKGLTPGGTAAFLAAKNTAFVPFAMDHYGGMGPSMSRFLFGTLTGKRREHGHLDDDSSVPAADLAAIGWVTPEMAVLEEERSYIPRFHPSSLDDQFKAAVEQIRKDAIPGDEIDTLQAQYRVRKDAVTLSTLHADGVAIIGRIFVSSITAAKGKTALLPSLSGSDACVTEEIFKAVEFIKARSAENDEDEPPYPTLEGILGDFATDDFDLSEDTQAAPSTNDGESRHQSIISPSSPSSLIVRQTVASSSSEEDPSSSAMIVDRQSPSRAMSIHRAADAEQDSAADNDTHSSSTINRLRKLGIHVFSPSQAALAAAALRNLRQKEHVSSAALQQIFTEHNIRIQTRGFCARDLASKVLKTLEISFTSVALLPREPPFTPSSADDLAEFLNSLSLAQPRA